EMGSRKGEGVAGEGSDRRQYGDLDGAGFGAIRILAIDPSVFVIVDLVRANLGDVPGEGRFGFALGRGQCEEKGRPSRQGKYEFFRLHLLFPLLGRIGMRKIATSNDRGQGGPGSRPESRSGRGGFRTIPSRGGFRNGRAALK